MVVALCSTETLVFIECSGLGTINLSSIINVQQEERNVECERKVLLLFSCLFISYVETTCNKKNTLPYLVLFYQRKQSGILCHVEKVIHNTFTVHEFNLSREQSSLRTNFQSKLPTPTIVCY